ncbi:hypothetical protein [Bdellovibrio bacteriovorus]|uniref:hypothetical protein n=1 Tax=Bdellovibrio bacteriovorus TaxID=959 RepID=UPI0035A72923
MKTLILVCFVFFSLTTQASELELIFYRAPKPLDWRTPGHLVRSSLRNMRMKVAGKNYPHPISHVNIRLQCGNEPSIYRGMTSYKSNASYLWDFFGKGQALDTFIINVPGRFYRNEEILAWLPYLKKKGYVRSLELQLNDEQCARAQRYLKLYEDLGLDQIYGGLRSLPHEGEGAGCSAFAVSFLQILDLFPESVDRAWRRELRVPLELMRTRSQSPRIGVLGYLRGRDRAWASPAEKHFVLKFWDPELMYNWVGDKGKIFWDVRTEPTSKNYFFAYRRNILDKTLRYHLKNLGRVLTDEEVLDTSSRPCRNFNVCR